MQCPDELSLQEGLWTVQGRGEGPAGDEAVAETLETVEESHTGHAQLQPPGPVLREGGEGAVFLAQQLGLVGRQSLYSGVGAEERFSHQNIGHDSSSYWAAPGAKRTFIRRTEWRIRPGPSSHRTTSGSV